MELQKVLDLNLQKNAGVAQLAEQLICNQQVAGSSPITSSKKVRFCSEIGLFYFKAIQESR